MRTAAVAASCATASTASACNAPGLSAHRAQRGCSAPLRRTMPTPHGTILAEAHVLLSQPLPHRTLQPSRRTIMKPFSKILVPVDFSPYSREATLYAVELGRRY